MRYADRVILLVKSDTEPRYDPDLGKMVGEEPKELILPCHISEQGFELKTQLDEKLELDARIVRLREDVPRVEKVLINNKPYRVVVKRHKALYVEEITNG